MIKRDTEGLVLDIMSNQQQGKLFHIIIMHIHMHLLHWGSQLGASYCNLLMIT